VIDKCGSNGGSHGQAYIYREAEEAKAEAAKKAKEAEEVADVAKKAKEATWEAEEMKAAAAKKVEAAEKAKAAEKTASEATSRVGTDAEKTASDAPKGTQSIALNPMSVKLEVDRKCAYIAYTGYGKRSCDQWGRQQTVTIPKENNQFFSNVNFEISSKATWPLTGAKKEGIAFRIDKVPDIKATAPGSFSSGNVNNRNLRVPVCSTILTMNASDSDMKFEAVELQLNMTRRGFICKNANDDMRVHVQTPSQDNKWSNYPQTYTCKDTSCIMKFPETNMLKATQFRLVMRCSTSGKKCDDNYECKLSQHQCYGRGPPAWHGGFSDNCMKSQSPCPGLADTSTGNEVTIKLVTKAGSFGWDDAVRSAMASEIATHEQNNLCPKVMNNSIVLKHFQQWVTPASGEFKQDPDPTKLPVSMIVDNVKWSVVAIKKHLAEPGEGIFHKYMLCFQKADADELCCVAKGVTSSQATVNRLAKARIKAL